MDYSIPIPIRAHSRYIGDYECICKCCSQPNKYINEWDGYSYIYSICSVCHTRVWHFRHICTLVYKGRHI